MSLIGYRTVFGTAGWSVQSSCIHGSCISTGRCHRLRVQYMTSIVSFITAGSEDYCTVLADSAMLPLNWAVTGQLLPCTRWFLSLHLSEIYVFSLISHLCSWLCLRRPLGPLVSVWTKFVSLLMYQSPTQQICSLNCLRSIQQFTVLAAWSQSTLIALHFTRALSRLLLLLTAIVDHRWSLHCFQKSLRLRAQARTGSRERQNQAHFTAMQIWYAGCQDKI